MKQTKWIDAVEILAGAYYFILAMTGFRNIYVIFYQERKLSTIIFPLMYFFGQLVCILQITQCFMFVKVNRAVIDACEVKDGAFVKTIGGLEITIWLRHFLAAERFLLFQTAFKGCIGCV